MPVLSHSTTNRCKMIKKAIHTILLSLMAEMFVYAQNLSVESFRMLEMDMTANTQGTLERDQNGEVAALIKLITTETGFAFDGGMMGIVKSSQKVSEIWVYVPHGIQKIKIMHQQLGQLEYYFPMPIESARTYEMKLITGTVRTIVEQATTSQFVVFKVSPINAVVYVDEDDPRTLDSEGMLSVRLNKGHHTYRVTATSYVPESGAIEVENEKITKQINLKSNTQLVTFRVTPSNAVVFIDEDDPRSLNSDGILSIRLERGNHTYRVTATSYIAEAGSFEIQSDEITKQIDLKSALATLTVNTAPDADIWINEIKKGTGSWTGSLEAGIYLIESRKSSHRTVQQEISLVQQEQKTITIAAPDPIYGSLEIISSPLESDVLIDGKLFGQTPLFIDKILAGDHSIEVKKKGYFGSVISVNVKENEVSNQSVTLSKGRPSDYMDLGLSVKWATYNIGANSPEEFGDYYAWGEVEVKDNYTWETYKYYDVSNKNLTKYNTDKNNSTGYPDNKTTLDPEDDVAHVKWGGNWRMPTKAEFDELRNNCKWTCSN